MELTFAMVKSGAVQRGRTTSILSAASIIGARITLLQHRRLTEEEVRLLYREHTDKPHWPDLSGSVMGGCGVVCFVLVGVDVVKGWRTLMGATNPKNAQPGTLRYDFSGTLNLADNAVHGSATLRDAMREIRIFFPDIVATAELEHFREMKEMEGRADES